MNPVLWAALLSTTVFVGTLGCLELGYRWGHRSTARAPDLAHEGIGAIEAAVFALLGLWASASQGQRRVWTPGVI